MVIDDDHDVSIAAITVAEVRWAVLANRRHQTTRADHVDHLIATILVVVASAIRRTQRLPW